MLKSNNILLFKILQESTLALLLGAVLIVIAIWIYILFQKKRKQLLQKFETAKKYEKEISESQLEIREQTLRNTSWELHDNIGQLVALAKLQLQGLDDNPINKAELNDNLTFILQEVRALSKVINPDFLSSMSLFENLQLEMNRFNKMKFIDTNLQSKGTLVAMDSNAEIVIFRILQEFFLNTIKHSKAKNLDVIVDYQHDKIIITAKDNGIGFDIQNYNSAGSGIKNIKKRGKLIHSTVALQSQIGIGTQLIITHKVP